MVAMTAGQYPTGFLPGVTDSRVDAPMSPSMRAVVAKALARLRNQRSSQELKPYLDDATGFIEAGMAQVARRSGQECGPIEASMILQGALNHAYSLYYWSKAAEDPANAKLVLMASKLGDAAKNCLSKALEMAVAVARSAPRQPIDPLANYMIPVPSANE